MLSGGDVFRTLRYYSIASLAVILVAGGAMVVVFRGVSVWSIERIAETSNVALGGMALGHLRDALADYLVAVAQAGACADPVIAATLLILAALCAVLLAVVGRLRASLEGQQATIREKTAVLELLSQESLRREERERKKFATDLHEGLAQTLSAVKMAIESAQRGPAEKAPLESVVLALQGAIGQVRTIAMDLRPPSLDDLGLAASIDALCRDFRAMYPGIRVETEVGVGEGAVPARLKFVIYRIVEGALKIVGQQGRASEVRIRLEMEDRTLSLRVEDNAQGFGKPHADLQSPFSAIHERAIITGGRLAISRTRAGGLCLVASWSPVAGTATERIPA
jgi:signal transduction histidine kinase